MVSAAWGAASRMLVGMLPFDLLASADPSPLTLMNDPG